MYNQAGINDSISKKLHHEAANSDSPQAVPLDQVLAQLDEREQQLLKEKETVEKHELEPAMMRIKQKAKIVGPGKDGKLAFGFIELIISSLIKSVEDCSKGIESISFLS